MKHQEMYSSADPGVLFCEGKLCRFLTYLSRRCLICLYLRRLRRLPVTLYICILVALKSAAIHRSWRTSVPGARFRRFGRKFLSLHACRLPSQSPVFSDKDGSFTPSTSEDFRLRVLFSAIRTEVLHSVRLETSVSESCFQ